MILALFYVWKMQESGVIEILPETWIYLGTCLLKAQSASSCFSSWIPLRGDCSGFQLNPCIAGWWVMLYVLLCSQFLCSLKLLIESSSLCLWGWNPHFLAAVSWESPLALKATHTLWFPSSTFKVNNGRLCPPHTFNLSSFFLCEYH